MPVTSMRAFISELAQQLDPPVRLGAALPDLNTADGQEQIAAWQETFGYGPLLPLVHKALQANAADVNLLKLQAECYLHQGLFQDAQRSAAAACAHSDNDPSCQALLRLIASESALATAADQPQVDAAGNEPLALAARAKDLFVRGDASALAVANRAVALGPNNFWVRMVQSDLTAHLLGNQASAPGAQAALALAPKSPAALYQVIRSHAPGLHEPAAQSDQVEARAQYSQLVALSPGSAWACLAAVHLGLGGELNPTGADGTGALAEDLRNGPMLSMALSQARAQADGGQKQAALATLDRAAQTFPDAYPIWAMRAELFAAMGNQTRQMESLDRARNLAQGAPFSDITLQLAGLALSRNDSEQAEEWLLQVLQRAPAHSAALLMLAQLRLLNPPKAASEQAQHFANIQAMAERALLGDPLYHAQAHYLIGLSCPDMTDVQRHLKAAIQAFGDNQDGPRKLDAQKGLYCRFVESDNFSDAQGVLDDLPEEVWPIFAAAADDESRGVETFRCRRFGEATVVKSRAAIGAKNFQQAIVDIEEALAGLDIRDDARLYATLLGIKSMAFFELELHTEARDISRKAIDTARGSAITKAASEAEIVQKRLAEHARSERKKWVLDFVTRYLWLIIGASGAGSLYTLGMSFVKVVKGAFNGSNTSRLTSHMRNQPKAQGD